MHFGKGDVLRQGELESGKDEYCMARKPSVLHGEQLYVIMTRIIASLHVMPVWYGKL